MSIKYILPDGRELSPGTPFTLGEIRYPSRWLALATEDDLSALGITTARADTPPDIMNATATTGELMAYLAELRWEAENAGTMWGEIPLPTDRERRSALKDAADKIRDGTLTAPISAAFSTDVYASVTLEQLDAAVNVITLYVQKVFSAAHEVAGKIHMGIPKTRQAVAEAFAAAMNPVE